MRIRITQVIVDKMHKVLVLDESKTTEEGKLLYVAESDSQATALQDAMEYASAALRNENAKTMWS